MTLSESQKRASAKYKEKNIKRIPLDVQKDNYDEIKIAAESSGETVNGFIKATINSKLSEIEIPLKESINTNANIQKDLEALLLENSDVLSSYSRVSYSDGTASLVLKFKNAALFSTKTVDAFKSLLYEYKVLN